MISARLEAGMDAAGVCVETLGAGNRRRIPHGNGNRNGRGMLGNWSGLKMFWVASTVVAVTSGGLQFILHYNLANVGCAFD